MHDLVEFGQRTFIFENNFPELAATDNAFSPANPLAKKPDDLLINFSPRLNKAVADPVGVNPQGQYDIQAAGLRIPLCAGHPGQSRDH